LQKVATAQQSYDSLMRGADISKPRVFRNQSSKASSNVAPNLAAGDALVQHNATDPSFANIALASHNVFRFNELNHKKVACPKCDKLLPSDFSYCYWCGCVDRARLWSCPKCNAVQSIYNRQGVAASRDGANLRCRSQSLGCEGSFKTRGVRTGAALNAEDSARLERCKVYRNDHLPKGASATPLGSF
jgi:hypothetical protein